MFKQKLREKKKRRCCICFFPFYEVIDLCKKTYDLVIALRIYTRIMYARYETDLCFIVFYSWEWLRFTMAWLKWKINLKYRAFSTRYITDTMCRERMTRIVSSLSLMTNVCTRERQRAHERQWGLGYNAWQIDCLNRIGFNELHRRAFRGQKGTTDGKNVRAP